MSKQAFYNYLKTETTQLKTDGLYKQERPIISPQAAAIKIKSGQEVINFCANNYLGLADHPDLIQVGQAALEQHGFGMASVRFICGTQSIHQDLEQRLSHFIGTEDCILYSSAFDANGGLFETLLSKEDAIISDALNHASIIDGVRLSKAMRYRYQNNDMQDLEAKLKEADAAGARFKLIATDGVFSMDGVIADLKSICDLADKYGALVMIDDCHSTGFMGKNGRGTHEYCDVMGRVDIITGTLGKALGGATGGYTCARKEVVTWLRQRSRPYLFSNALAPVVTAVSLKVLELLESSDQLRKTLHENATYLRNGLTAAGFKLIPGQHPILPVMLGDAKLAAEMADKLLHEGIYVIGFSYPVVPQGKARIRIQLSAAHTKAQLDKAIAAFTKVGKEMSIV